MGDWTPLLGLVAAFIMLLFISRWINQHLQGVGLLLTGSEEASIYFYFVVLFPGVLLHELSHWLMAKLLRLRTGRIRLWPSKKGRGKYLSLGSVEVARADPLRDSLVGLAPLLAGCGMLLLISYRIFDIGSILTGLATEGFSQADLWPALGSWTGKRDFWLWLYLIFCISNAMVPSARDREPWTPVLVFLSLAAGLFYITGHFPRIPPPIIKTARAWTLTLAYSLGFVVIIDIMWALILASIERLLQFVTGKRILY